MSKILNKNHIQQNLVTEVDTEDKDFDMLNDLDKVVYDQNWDKVTKEFTKNSFDMLEDADKLINNEKIVDLINQLNSPKM